MDNSKLHDALAGLGIESRYQQREIAILQRKKVRRVDPYYTLLSILTYLYCLADAERFKNVFDPFVADQMEDHFKQNFELWTPIERVILMYADLVGDSQYNRLIPEKGLVKSRLERSLLELERRNLKSELAEFERGHDLPKETIVGRYQGLLTECLLIIQFKKTGLFGSHKRTKADLQRYRQLYLSAQEHFYEPDNKFIASLEQIGDNLL